MGIVEFIQESANLYTFFKIIIISNIEFSFLIGIDNMTVIIL